MKRLSATIICDVRLQVRNGFYYAAGFVALFWVLTLSQVPVENLGGFMPVFILSNLLINTFYFIAGLVLLEKGEGTLMAQVVTPLRAWEYLASKVITLTGLSLLENLLIVGLGYGLNFNLLPLLIGMSLATTLYSLVGFVAVSRYDSINEYLFPSFLYTLVFIPPFLPYMGLGESWLFYLHPLQAPLLLTKAAFQPVTTWQWLYGLLYAGLWIGLFLGWSRQAFAQFVVAAEGAR
ncbi:MAG: ABC transporter permease [Anaerolineales bacterium]|nr:ABC transporter permease [Anaerolineales bacterium]